MGYIVRCGSSGPLVIPTEKGSVTLNPGDEFDLAENSTCCWMVYNSVIQSFLSAGLLKLTENTFTETPRSGAFAYTLGTPTVITTIADTWYPIPGPFSNVVMNDFSVPAPYDYIIYNNGLDFFEIQTNGTWSTDTIQTTLQTAVRVNGIIESGSLHIAKIAQVGQYRHLGSTTVVELDKNDEIQLVVKSDIAGAVLTLHKFTTSAQKFY